MRNHGLSIALFVLFFFSLLGQSIAGVQEYNDDQRQHGQPPAGYFEYLGTGHFIEAVFENWESEFLQMALYVVLTAVLRQKGSAESKKLEGEESVDEDPRQAQDRQDAPWPVRRGGVVLTLYEHSLSITLFLLFVLSFMLHAAAGAREFSQDQVAHGESAVSLLAYLGTSRMWFESLQNWQSEFLSIAVLAILSIFLRERGSPESKPVASPHGATGQG